MMTPETNPILNQWALLYEEYPLLRHFRIEDIIKCDSLLKVPFHFQDQSIQIRELSNAELNYALNYVHSFLSKQEYNFRYLLRFDISELTEKFVPKRKKIKALWNLQIKDLDSIFNIYFFAIAKQLMNKGFNPDLLLSQLEELIKVLNKEYRHSLGAHLLLIDDLKIKTSVIDFLQDYYNDRRIIRLFFYGYIIKGEKSQVTELDRVLQEFKCRELIVPEECLPNKPKTFGEIFGPLVATFDEETILLSEDFTLRQWQKLKDFKNKKVIILNAVHNIQVPDTRHALVYWGRRFQNCIGYKEQYIEEIQTNDGILFFVMCDDYPMYCVFYSEDRRNINGYEFEAKSLGNERLYQEEETELLELAKKLYNHETLSAKIQRMVLGNKDLYDLASFISKFSF